jgi:hypothetical protein
MLNVGRLSGRSTDGTVVHQPPRWKEPAMKEPTMKLILVFFFMALQLIDVASTNHVLKIGGHEANPLMVAAQFNLGAQWWLPKLMLAAASCLLLLRRLQIWAITSPR